MTKDEALKMAIDTLIKANYDEKFMELCLGDEWYEETIEKAINACKEALDTKQVCENAAPAQEPVAWIKEVEVLYMKAHKADGIMNWKTNLGLKPEPDDIPLYTHPAPQPAQEYVILDGIKYKKPYTHPHQWQGLTDEEMDKIFDETTIEKGIVFHRTLFKAIEQALKEKNNG